MRQPTSFDDHFVGLTDPRVERTKVYSLRDIVVLALCGAENWVGIEQFDNAVRGHRVTKNQLH